MFKNSNRGMSAFLTVGVVAVLIIFVGGGVLVFNYDPEKEPLKSQAPASKSTATSSDSIVLDNEKLLGKMFPGYEVQNGKIEILKDELVDVEVSLDETFKEAPLYLDKDRVLFAAKMTGVPHFYGGYRAFLSVFDSKGNILTPSFSIPKSSGIGDLVESLENIKRESGAFSQKGSGQFLPYECNGTDYLLFEEKFCVVAMCYGSANVYKFQDGKFIDVQKITSADSLTGRTDLVNVAFAAGGDASKSIMVIPGADKISIYQGKSVKAGFVCDTKCLDWSGEPIKTTKFGGEVYIFRKDLFWDKNSCRFN